MTTSVSDLITQYLAESFGAPGSRASWYDDVRGVTVRFSTALVRTSLSMEPADQEKAVAISQAVSSFCRTGPGKQVSGLTVEVYAHNGQLLVSRPREATMPQPTPYVTTIDPG